MPQMGVSVSEGTVSKWCKQVGETIAQDETIVEISTDKVDTEVPSPAAGTVVEILVQEGQTVDVNTTIARISAGGGAPTATTPPPPPPPSAAPASAAPAVVAVPTPPLPVAVVAAPPQSDDDQSMRSFMSPVVARMVAEHGLDIAAIPGTGRGGRVTKKDVEGFLTERGAPDPAPVPASAATAPVAAPTPTPVAQPAPIAAPLADDIELLPLTTIRKAIARNMRASIDTNAHVTSLVEIDMTRVWNLRKEVNAQYNAAYSHKVSFLPFIMRVVCEAVSKWPLMNAELRADGIAVKHHVNLGIAVSIEDGKELIVPVIHRAEEKNLLGLSRALQELAERGRVKQLTPDEMSGGSITITNPGSYGTLIGTPIIPPGQAAIVSVCAIVKRPVVVTDEHGNDSISIRQMMYLPVSYDHRLIDGAYSAQFMGEIKHCLETWEPGDYGA